MEVFEGTNQNIENTEAIVHNETPIQQKDKKRVFIPWPKLGCGVGDLAKAWKFVVFVDESFVKSGVFSAFAEVMSSMFSITEINSSIKCKLQEEQIKLKFRFNSENVLVQDRLSSITIHRAHRQICAGPALGPGGAAGGRSAHGISHACQSARLPACTRG